MNSLMGKIAEKCRIMKPDKPKGRNVSELRKELETIKKFI